MLFWMRRKYQARADAAGVAGSDLAGGFPALGSDRSPA